jgi:hypothetical protein
VRGAIDALVQGALVELFQAYGVAMAPLPRSALHRAPNGAELCAAISFSYPRSRAPGRLVLVVPTAVLGLLREVQLHGTQEDWLKELANQLLGRIKNRLLQFSVSLTIGLPTTHEAAEVKVDSSSPLVRIYLGRTLKGHVVATLEGLPPESELVYVGPSAAASEGETILF